MDDSLYICKNIHKNIQKTYQKHKNILYFTKNIKYK